MTLLGYHLLRSRQIGGMPYDAKENLLFETSFKGESKVLIVARFKFSLGNLFGENT